VAESRNHIAPPTRKQIEALKVQLKNCAFIETAATLVGIPKRRLFDWLKLGRGGHPDFLEFINAIDQANAELASNIMEPIKKAAFEEGNISALTFLYNARMKEREQHFTKKQLALEDVLEADNVVSMPSEEDIAGAEARALAAVDEDHEVH
jgi:hypothetical protein